MWILAIIYYSYRITTHKKQLYKLLIFIIFVNYIYYINLKINMFVAASNINFINNEFTESIISFCKNLKAYLFNIAFFVIDPRRPLNLMMRIHSGLV